MLFITRSYCRAVPSRAVDVLAAGMVERNERVRAELEREEKFEVDRGWVLPDVGELVPEGGRVIEDVRRLESTYFDTPERRLLEFGVTLRRRVGGGETGWQLKVPAGSARTELQSKSTRPTIPKDLSGAVAGLRGDRELLPVASVSTTRTARRVVDADGEVLFEIADDDVQTTTLGERGHRLGRGARSRSSSARPGGRRRWPRSPRGCGRTARNRARARRNSAERWASTAPRTSAAAMRRADGSRTAPSGRWFWPTSTSSAR